MGAVVEIGEAISLVTALLQNAVQINQLIQQAQVQGKTTLDSSAWSQIIGNDDSAMATLAKELGIQT